MAGGKEVLLAAAIARDEADRRYFLVRAETELELAQVSMCPHAVRCHYELGGHYFDLADNDKAFTE